MTFLTRETVFLEVGGAVGRLRYLRCIQALPFSLSLLSPPPPPPPAPTHTVTCSLFHLPAMSVSLERASFHSTQHQVTKRRESLRTSWVQ